MEFWLGLLIAIFAAFLFGIQYVPCKRYDTYDGATFQWFMCCGILFGGTLVQLFGMLVLGWAEADLGQTDPQLILYGVLGGVIWGMANFFVIPLVKVAGLALGFSLYHVVNLVTGYATSRFGLFGMLANTGSIPALRDSAVFVLLLSFVLLFFVEPASQNCEAQKKDRPETKTISIADDKAEDTVAMEEAREEKQGENGEEDEELCREQSMTESVSRVMGESTREAVFYQQVGNFGKSMHGPPKKTKHFPETASVTPLTSSASVDPRQTDSPLPDSDTEKAHPKSWGKQLLGVGLAVVAGTLTGLNACPFEVWTQTAEGQRMKPIQFVFSQTVGVFLSSTFLYLIYGGVARLRSRRVHHSVIRPAFVSGLLWVMGNTCQLYGISAVGYPLGYSLAAVGPVMVASLLSVLLFKEIRNRKQLLFFWCAFALQSAGCIMLALGT